MSKKYGQLLRRRGRIRPLAPQSCEKKRKFQIIFAMLKFEGMTVGMMRNKKTIVSWPLSGGKVVRWVIKGRGAGDN